uniref:Integrase, catalytic region, zinc finger, CCHC-type, peptidase aspartic, catalytic n=1 Tax=Tanacetum cinerariifolium TaxID=118510 RepID=A0A699KEU3_TANCI|nr:hypothetical protein [Tanacetum cinerariifolium]
MWSDQEKKIQKIDRLAISLLIKGLPNDIYSLIDRNETAKDLWDALERQMRGSEYGEQDRKAAILYEYEIFKATEGKQFLDTYLRYLQVINDLKKCGYKKDNCELNYKFLNNLQPEWKHYATMMRQNKNLTDINIDALYNILKKNQGDVNDAMGLKKKTVVITSDPLALIAEKTKVLLAEDQAWMESSSDSDQEINATMVFMAQIEKVLLDSEASSSSADEKISKVLYYLSESESESEYETSKYYDNTSTYGIFVNDNDDQEIFHECENFLENLIESQIDHIESVIDHNDSEGIDKLIRKFNKKIAKCLKGIEKANQQNKDFENQNKDLQDKYDILCNTPKLGRSGIWDRGVLLHRSITQDIHIERSKSRLKPIH